MNKSESCFLESRQERRRQEEFDEVNDLFNKKFQFRFNTEWKLPDIDSWFSTPPWRVKQLDGLKTRLNYHKSQLNDFNIEEWSSHTRRRNPSGEVGWKVRSQINPEFLTQAWTKFYECAFTYNIVPKEALNDRKMVSLHLCEAPGAFITSLNHYLKSHHSEIEWEWVANTLNPYYEGNSSSHMISDDRFMFHTLHRWDFGSDNTGNLMLWDNSQSIIRKATALGKVLLVTADGSIDCLQKPDAQEEVTSPLHYCEIVTALQALSPGGTLIFKLFTIFEHSTVSLLYLINHLFGEVNIYKPVTSRQGNSEVYAICLNFKGTPELESFIPVLKSAYGTDLYSILALFPRDAIPESFIKQVEECQLYFSSIQCQVIDNNLQAYLMQNNIALHRDVRRVKAVVASEFLWYYELKPLDAEHEILKGILHEENKINTNPRYHRGSYTERELYTKMGLKEKCNNLNKFLNNEILSNPMMPMAEETKWMDQDENSVLDLVFTRGLPVQKISSSKFIFVPIFKLFQQILAEAEFKDIILSKNFKFKGPDLIDLNGEHEKIMFMPDFNYQEPYHVHEKRSFRSLVKTLRELSMGDSLTVQNWNTLTQFNVSVLYILSRKCFAKTGFSSCGDIILNNLLNKDCMSYLDAIEKECDRVAGNLMLDVLNVLPVQVTNAGEFFSNIVFYNNTFYRNKCKDYLYSIDQALEY